MKDTCASTALVAAIAGTSARTHDDAPTVPRQQRLVSKAFVPLVAELGISQPASNSQEWRFCAQWGP